MHFLAIEGPSKIIFTIINVKTGTRCPVMDGTKYISSIISNLDHQGDHEASLTLFLNLKDRRK